VATLKPCSSTMWQRTVVVPTSRAATYLILTATTGRLDSSWHAKSRKNPQVD
jgi:hypothetical protein